MRENPWNQKFVSKHLTSSADTWFWQPSSMKGTGRTENASCLNVVCSPWTPPVRRPRATSSAISVTIPRARAVPFPSPPLTIPWCRARTPSLCKSKGNHIAGGINSMGDGRGSSRPATVTRPNSFRKHHWARSLDFCSNSNLNLRLVRAPKHSELAPQALYELFVSLCCYDAHTSVYDNVSFAHASCSELLTSSRRGSTPAAAHFLSNADKWTNI